METVGRCRYRPWCDLPDPLLEIILEGLPLSDYIRFSAVCRRWRSVQAAHRHGHSPLPPPVRRLPWLIAGYPSEKFISCYSPFEGKSFAIPLPPLYFGYFSHGWLLKFTCRSSTFNSGNFFLWNPISGEKIEPPRGRHPLPSSCMGVKLVSSPPNYILSLTGISSMFLFRWFDPRWVELKPPPGVNPDNKAVFCGGNYYSICHVHPRSRELLVVDALAAPPTIQYVEMAEQPGCWNGKTHLVELDDEPLLVKETLNYEKGCRTKSVGLELFRLDLPRKMWVKVESIGDDRVLLLHWYGSQYVSLLASDIGTRGNRIYFSIKKEGSTKADWKMFDLVTGRVTDFLPPNASHLMHDPHLLFAPSL